MRIKEQRILTRARLQRISIVCLSALAAALVVISPSRAQVGEIYLIIASNRLISEADEVKRFGGEVIRNLNNIDALVTRMSPQAAEQLAKIFTPRGTLIEKESVFYPLQTQSTPSTYWNLDRIDERLKGSLPGYTYEDSRSGQSIDAYVIDTGIRLSHNEFEGRARELWRGSQAGVVGSDCDGHGTHVAGTIGGKTTGVAKKVTLVAVAPYDCARGYFTSTDLATGVDRIVAEHNPTIRRAVANMSLGGGASSTLDTLVTKMHNDGIAVVVAAGNSNANACNYSPARAATAITVGATDSLDTRAWFSNFGSCVDLFAPGVSIYSSWHLGDSSYGTLSGTSMSSPLVAGLAVRVLSKFPGVSSNEVSNLIRNSATSNLVNSIGTGSPNLLSFINPSNLLNQPTSVSNLSATPPLGINGAVDLQWNLPSITAGVTTPLYRVLLEYSLTNTFSNSSVVELSTSSTSTRISSLTGGTTYYFRVKLFDLEGRASLSESVAATPTADLISMPPSGTANLGALASITRSSFVTNWAYSDLGGTATGFTIQYSTSANFTSQVTNLNVNSGATRTQLISGLRARTTYWVRIRATNGFGSGPWSNTSSATTLR